MTTDQLQLTTAAPRSRFFAVHMSPRPIFTADGCLGALVFFIATAVLTACIVLLIQVALRVIGFSGQLGKPVSILGGLFISVCALAWIAQRRNARMLRQWISEHPISPDGDVASWAMAFVDSFSRDQQPPYHLLFTAIRNSGHAGAALCVAPPSRQLCSTPIPDVFEPRLLSDYNAGLLTLAAGLTPPAANLDLPANQNPDDATSPWAAWRFRALTRSTWGKLCMLGFLWFAGSAIWTSYQQAAPSTSLYMIAFALAFSLFGPVRLGMHNKQFIVVPGGLLVREYRRTHSSRPRLKLYRAAASVLGVVIRNQNDWMLYVADAEGDHRVAVAATEAEVALRAWLSPIPPPRIEELSDLAE